MYQPTPQDVRCANPHCREWYHRRLPACPMCDTPNVPLQPPVVQLPRPVHVPPVRASHAPTEAYSPVGVHTPRASIVLTVCAVVVLLAWGGVRVWVIQEEQRQMRDNIAAVRSAIRDFEASWKPSSQAP